MLSIAAIGVFIGVFSLAGGVRLIALALSDQLEILAAQPVGGKPKKLSAEDAVLMVIGGIAIAWVSIQGVVEVFVKLVG